MAQFPITDLALLNRFVVERMFSLELNILSWRFWVWYFVFGPEMCDYISMEFRIAWRTESLHGASGTQEQDQELKCEWNMPRIRQKKRITKNWYFKSWLSNAVCKGYLFREPSTKAISWRWSNRKHMCEKTSRHCSFAE